MNVKVEFVKTEKDLNERMGQNGDDKPALIIFDLNNVSAKPLSIIPKLKTKLKKATNIIGFLSHVQGELKMKAQEAGCDMVVPRSAFSQNLAQILRRHGAPEELPEPGTVGFEAVDQRDYLRRCEISGRCCCAADVALVAGKREIVAFFVRDLGAQRNCPSHLL